MTDLLARREGLSVSEVAEAARVATSTVRFHERYGVVTSWRDGRGHRRFDESAPCRILVALMAREVGVTLREVAEMFEGIEGEPTPDEWSRVTSALIAAGESRMAQLRQRLGELRSDQKVCTL